MVCVFFVFWCVFVLNEGQRLVFWCGNRVEGCCFLQQKCEFDFDLKKKVFLVVFLVVADGLAQWCRRVFGEKQGKNVAFVLIFD